MNISRREDLISLYERSKFPAVTIYMSTHPNSAASRQDNIRLKNFLDETMETLLARGVRPGVVNDIVAPARQKLEEGYFFRNQRGGLVLFLGEGVFEFATFPTVLNDKMFIENHFHIRPLLSHFNIDGSFFLLAMSLHKPRLFRGNRNGLSEIQMDNIEARIEDALAKQPIINDLQGDERDFHEGHQKVARMVEEEVWKLLHNQRIPLVYLGSEVMLGVYRSLNRYQYMLPVPLSGGAEKMSAEEMHRRAWALVEPGYLQELDKELQRFEMLKGQRTTLASDKIEETLVGAAMGRVDYLSLPEDGQVWGKFLEDAQTVEVHDRFEDGDEDLLELAACLTLKNQGEVYVLPPSKIPGKGPVATVFRY